MNSQCSACRNRDTGKKNLVFWNSDLYQVCTHHIVARCNELNRLSRAARRLDLIESVSLPSSTTMSKELMELSIFLVICALEGIGASQQERRSSSPAHFISQTWERGKNATKEKKKSKCSQPRQGTLENPAAPELRVPTTTRLGKSLLVLLTPRLFCLCSPWNSEATPHACFLCRLRSRGQIIAAISSFVAYHSYRSISFLVLPSWCF